MTQESFKHLMSIQNRYFPVFFLINTTVDLHGLDHLSEHRVESLANYGQHRRVSEVRMAL